VRGCEEIDQHWSALLKYGKYRCFTKNIWHKYLVYLLSLLLLLLLFLLFYNNNNFLSQITFFPMILEGMVNSTTQNFKFEIVALIKCNVDLI
jgi:hypothetical protein